MTRTLQKIGNSKGLVLTKTMLDHLGVTDTVEVQLIDKQIVLTAPAAPEDEDRAVYEKAKRDTVEQYAEAIRRLGDASEL